jgi:transcriptional regulator with XRE-family HTH domain
MGVMQMNIDKHRQKIIARLKDKEHRDAYVSANIDIGIPFQIRALREKKGWTQKELAERSGKKQAWIAKLESPNYSGFSLKTLKQLASVFDVGLIVRYVPFSDLIKWELEISPEKLMAVSFDEDTYFKPPVTHIVGSGGFVMGGEGIINWTYPSEQPQILQPPQARPHDELAKYRKAKQKIQLKNKSSELMAGMEEDNETAVG